MADIININQINENNNIQIVENGDNIQVLISNGSSIDIYVTGGTYSNGTAEFTNNYGFKFDVTGFTSTDKYVTGGTYNNGITTFTNNFNETFDVNGYFNGYPYTPEDIANKQNSLLIDGSGIKYPTVDTVNNLINTISRAVIQTGFVDTSDGFSLYKYDDNTLGISGSTIGIVFSDLFKTNSPQPQSAIVTLPSRLVPLSDIGLTDGSAVKFVGYRQLDDSIIFSDDQFIQSPTVCQLGVVLVKNSGGTTSFIDENRTFINQPDIASYSNLETTGFGVKSSVIIDNNDSDLKIKNTGGSLIGISVNWHGSNNDLLPITISDPTGTTFSYLFPGEALSPNPISFVSDIDPTRYWNGSALVNLPTTASTTVQRFLVTIRGNIAVQYGEFVYSNFQDGLNNASIQTFSDVLPLGTFAEVGRLVVISGCTNLSDPTKAVFLTTGGNGGGGSTVSPTTIVWGNITGSISDQTDLQSALNSKLPLITSPINNIPKITSTGLTNSQIIDNGSRILISTTTDDGINTLQVNGTGKFSGAITGNGIVSIGAFISKRSLNSSDFAFTDNISGLQRWSFFRQTTETGTGNTGNDILLARYSDAGSYLGNAFTIKRSDATFGVVGRMFVNNGVDNGVDAFQVNGTMKTNNAIKLNDGLTSTSIRPPVTSARTAGEIAGVSSGGELLDDGFLRLSAGGGTNSNQKSYIDLTGFAGGGASPDMLQNIVFGTSGVERMRVRGTGNIVINQTTDNGVDKLQVNGSAFATSFKKSGGTPNQFLMADGSITYISGNTLQTAYNNSIRPQITTSNALGSVTIKQGSGLDTDLIFTVLNGASATTFSIAGNGQVVCGFDSTFNGVKIGKGGGSIANNVALGLGALSLNISGDSNTAIGNSVLNSNTTGFQNAGLGRSALLSNTIGIQNTAIGGGGPLSTAISGNNNTSIGYASLVNLGNFDDNIALGSNAGRYVVNTSTNLTATTNSIFIGDNSKASANNNTNEIVIGFNTIGNGSNSVTLGNTSITKTILQGNTLIGTTTDNGVDKLQVNGSAFATSFKKSGGLSTQFLMADGSVSSGNTLFDVTITGTSFTINSNNTRYICTSSASTIATVSSGITDNITVLQYGTGQVSFTGGTGTTLRYSSFVIPTISEQYASAALSKLVNNGEIRLYGELASI